MTDEARSLLAHDLRTPLSVIVGYAELLRLREDEATRLAASAEILAAAARLSAMLDELLAELELNPAGPPPPA